MAETPLEALTAALSADRLSTYLVASEGHQERAIRLYRWNSMASSAFYGCLQLLEVTLRNAIDTQMVERWGLRWWERDECPISERHNEMLEEAVRELEAQRHATAHGDVVASLSFGFWVGLLGSGGRDGDYETQLWRPALHKALPGRPERSRRRDIHERIDYLRTFRNRIAHHEPIFDRDLSADHASVITVLRWVSDEVADWVLRYSRFPAVLMKKAEMLNGEYEGTL